MAGPLHSETAASHFPPLPSPLARLAALPGRRNGVLPYLICQGESGWRPGKKSSGIVPIRASGARIPAPPGALGSHSPLGAKFRTRSVRGVPENRLQMSAPRTSN